MTVYRRINCYKILTLSNQTLRNNCESIRIHCHICNHRLIQNFQNPEIMINLHESMGPGRDRTVSSSAYYSNETSCLIWFQILTELYEQIFII